MKKRLLFISPRFLFPTDSGGKIRTSQILRGMKGGAFEITLVSPQSISGRADFEEDITSVCDEFLAWPNEHRDPLFWLTRMWHLTSSLPISVALDRCTQAAELIASQLHNMPDVVIFDFVHSAVLAPQDIAIPSVMFTHNVETEIFHRHHQVSTNPLMRVIWRDQLRKMERFERKSLSHFDTLITVSTRDADYFRNELALDNVEIIPTGTDLEFFEYHTPTHSLNVVFTGSMDWSANIDGIQYLMSEVWPLVIAEIPEARMKVVGRNPPAKLINAAKSRGGSWHFTGFVDDVRPYVHEAAAYVIPLRVGGGTRIKAFEAMAMGCPVVSTPLGVEGLGLTVGTHYLAGDTTEAFANMLIRLLRDAELRESLSHASRLYVEENCSSRSVAERFEEICLATIMRKTVAQ